MRKYCFKSFPIEIHFQSIPTQNSNIFSYKSIELAQKVSRWTHASYGWENAIREILSANSLIPTITTIQEPRSVFRPCALQ